MAGFTIRLEGLPQTQAAIRAVGPRGRVGLKRGMRTMGERIMGMAKGLTPVKFGALRRSGFVTQDEAGGVDRVVLAFGGDSAPYAEIQHERLDFRHTVGQAKYLETPFLAEVNNIPAVVADFVRGSVENGGGQGPQPGGGYVG